MAREPKNHALKIWPMYFYEVAQGNKTFEVRKNDRDYQEDDSLTLMNFDPVTEQYLEGIVNAKIGYVYPIPSSDLVVFSVLDSELL